MSKEDPTGLDPYTSSQAQNAAADAQEEMTAGPLNAGAAAKAGARATGLQVAGQIAQSVGLSGRGTASWGGSGGPTFSQGGQTHTQAQANDVSAMVSGINGSKTGRQTNTQVASNLIYNNNSHTLSLVRDDGTTTNYPAYNNTAKKSGGPIPAGDYPYLGHVAHRDDGPESAYGSNGGYKFDVPGRTNIEVHSGRYSTPDLLGRSGPEAATLGCIRTNDAGTSGIQDAITNNDPPTTLSVIR